MKKRDILVVGAGPAGLCAALEAAALGAQVTMIDSDLKPGGQLVKQTHKFFGSQDEYAGTRGFVIAEILLKEIKKYQDKGQISLQSNTTAVSYDPDSGAVGCLIGDEKYFTIKPERLVVAAGAQERLIPFPGNDLPGVYGAGAVQTLMNLYGVCPGDKALMVGAGNIGLIVGYQMMQAGVEIVAIIEALPRIGGYWVHAAKVRRLGVPILLCHSIKEALGDSQLSGAIVQEIDPDFKFIGREKRFDCDIICLAVGLSPTVELLRQAGCEMKYIPQLCGYVPIRDAQMGTSNRFIWAAGDASGIEEASAAMIEGRIAGLAAAASLGYGREKEQAERRRELEKRLVDLRSGEVGDKIRAGLKQARKTGRGV